MFENRRHFRLKHYMDVNWNVHGQEEAGEGTVFNLSLSGALFQTDKVFKPADNCVVLLKSQNADAPFEEKKGRLMWFKRISTPEDRFQCGIQFLDQGTDLKYQQWIDERITQLSEATDVNILSKQV